MAKKNVEELILERKEYFKLFEKPFCIVSKKGDFSLYKGEIKEFNLISDLPRIEKDGANYISLLPFCQMKEKGFETHDDGEKIITLLIDEEYNLNLDNFNNEVPDKILEMNSEIDSNMTDEEFENTIDSVIRDEIKKGEGSNFLMSRKFFGEISNFVYEDSLSILKRLIDNETGSYWNFIFFTGKNIFIGASPERHLVINGETTIMNPISGTLPKAGGNLRERLEEFIMDPKEINELFQVLDEELKIICKLCPKGGKVDGPYLKEMGTLIHTEYLLIGTGSTDVWNSLKESMYAATMVGSPLENASRIVKKYEKDSRKYYSSVICLFGKNSEGQNYLDNTITIRTIEIDLSGKFTIQSGNSIVRDSNPKSETKELKAKAQGLINAMLNKKKVKSETVKFDEELQNKLIGRNVHLSKFWLKTHDKSLVRKNNIKIDLIDNEDDFIYMIRHILDYLGCNTNVYKFNEYKYKSDADIVVIGPGPGDPNNPDHEKMNILFNIVKELLDKNVKIMGVCLGHQILSRVLGFELTRALVPFQGLQKEIDLFGKKQNVGFYNSFFSIDKGEIDVEISKNPEDNKVYAMKGKNFISFQFHFESVLTQNSLEIMQSSIDYLMK